MRLKLNEVQGLVEEMSTNWTVSTLTGGLLENGEKKTPSCLGAKTQGTGRKASTASELWTETAYPGHALVCLRILPWGGRSTSLANWLQELTRVSDADGRVEYRFAGLPISIEFLGLFRYRGGSWAGG